MKGNNIELKIKYNGEYIVDNISIESSQFFKNFGTLDKFKHSSTEMHSMFEMMYYCNIMQLIMYKDSTVMITNNDIYIIDIGKEKLEYINRTHWKNSEEEDIIIETNLLRYVDNDIEMELDYVHENALELILNYCNLFKYTVKKLKKTVSEITNLEYMMGCIQCDDGTFVEI